MPVNLKQWNHNLDLNNNWQLKKISGSSWIFPVNSEQWTLKFILYQIEFWRIISLRRGGEIVSFSGVIVPLSLFN